MPPDPPAWGGIWENDSYRAACDGLCKDLGISQRRLDEITAGVTWALGENPLQFESIGENVYVAPIRGGGQHDDLVVLYTYEIATNETTLQWIG